MTKNRISFLAGFGSAVAASLCCIAPVLAVLGGAGSIGSFFSWLEPYRPYFMGMAILTFSVAWYQKLKPPKRETACVCEANKKSTFWQSRTFLGIVTLLAGLLIAFPYYSNAFYNNKPGNEVTFSSQASVKQAVFKIKGMSCEGCTQHIDRALAKVRGVIGYHTSFEQANSIVEFDNLKTSIDSITAAIKTTGYKVALLNLINH